VGQALVRTAATVLRAYYHHLPAAAGKRTVWYHIVKPLLRSGATLQARTRFGARMRVQFPDTIQTYIYFFGVWEPAITAYLEATLAPGDTVIDIGANVGYDTLLAAHCVGPGGRVFAIEASPRMFALLRDNLALNDATCVEAFNAAVCAKAGDVAVYLHDGSNLGATTIVPAVAARRGAVLEAVVRGRPLADIVPEEAILSARIIKIDVEGAEFPVVRGFVDLLPRLSHRTELLIEVSAEALHDHSSSVEEFLGIFRSAGFSPFAIDNRYSVDMYLQPAPARLEPLLGYGFEQLDVVFRRTH
jgi:FkbM family methyltransferase